MKMAALRDEHGAVKRMAADVEEIGKRKAAVREEIMRHEETVHAAAKA
jgi:hypothetical protein